MKRLICSQSLFEREEEHSEHVSAYRIQQGCTFKLVGSGEKFTARGVSRTKFGQVILNTDKGRLTLNKTDLVDILEE